MEDMICQHTIVELDYCLSYTLSLIPSITYYSNYLMSCYTEWRKRMYVFEMGSSRESEGRRPPHSA